MIQYLTLRNLVRGFRKIVATYFGKLSLLFGLSPIRQVISFHDPYRNSTPNNEWEWHCIFPPETHHRSLPAFYGKVPLGVLDEVGQQQKHCFPQGGFVKGPGQIYGAQGAVVMGRGDLLLEPSRKIGTNILEHTIFRPHKPPPTQFEEDVFFAWYDQGSNFFHWLTDILPLLLIPPFRQRLSDISSTVVLPDIVSPFQTESLRLLGLDRLKTTPISRIGLLESKELFVPILPQTTGQVHPKVRKVLRSSLSQPAMDASSTRPKRLYISRRQGTRSVVNEAEILELLLPLGFESICLENLNLAQQISLFSQTEFLVAPHGAGLTHIVFLPENARIVELFSNGFYNGCYWRLSCLGSHSYASVFGEAALHSRIPEIDNYYINPHDLALAVKCFL